VQVPVEISIDWCKYLQDVVCCTALVPRRVTRGQATAPVRRLVVTYGSKLAIVVSAQTNAC